MNKAQLTSLVADQVSLSKDTARPVVAAVFSTIGEPLARSDNVSFADFGAFTPRTRAPARAPLPALDQRSSPSSRFCLVRDAEGRWRRGCRRHVLAPAFARPSAGPGGMRIAPRPFRVSRLAPHTALHSSDSSMPSDADVQRGLPLPRCAVLAETPP